MKAMQTMIVLVVTGLWLTAILALHGCAPKVCAPESLLDTPEHHVQSGMKLLRLGKCDDAMREFELAKGLNPKFSGAYVGSGLVLGHKGEFKEAIEHMEKAFDLAETKKPWKVVYFHSPPFSSGTVHGSNEELRRVIGPIFSKHHVNLVVSGHDHLYERSKPVNLLMSPDAPVSSYRDGTCYIVSAGAGAGLYDAQAGNWWTAVLKTKIHHLCRVKVNGSKSMTLQAVSLDGNIIDSITLEN